MLRIHNVRLGHACNSSSTHSIVPIHAVGHGGGAGPWQDDAFGWEPFDLDDAQSKMRYLAATLWGTGVQDPERVTALTGVEPDAGELADFRREPKGWHQPFGYVDHQSVLSLPIDGPHADEFLRDFAEYLRRDDVVILGGNDNDGRGPNIGISGIGTEYDRRPRVRPGVGPKGERYWTLYQPQTGDRFRISFDGQPLDGPGDPDYGVPAVEADPLDLAYGDLPELVDLKVTGYCPFEKDCPWCYMGSTSEGDHADPEVVEAWLRAFAAAGVFEVALGGGEPTLWPGLPAFVKLAGSLDVRVNLTTKNIAWLKPENVADLGAVAISINNARDLERLKALAAKRGGEHGMLRYALATPDEGGQGRTPGGEPTVQCVPAFCDDALLDGILAFAVAQNVRVTFLGVKRTGRAEGEERADDLRWIDALRRLLADDDRPQWRRTSFLGRMIAVDTLMAAASEEAFAEMGVDPVWFETAEGKFSCYVDATTGHLAASSYADPEAFCAASPDLLPQAFRDAQRKVGLR